MTVPSDGLASARARLAAAAMIITGITRDYGHLFNLPDREAADLAGQIASVRTALDRLSQVVARSHGALCASCQAAETRKTELGRDLTHLELFEYFTNCTCRTEARVLFLAGYDVAGVAAAGRAAAGEEALIPLAADLTDERLARLIASTASATGPWPRVLVRYTRTGRPVAAYAGGEEIPWPAPAPLT